MSEALGPLAYRVEVYPEQDGNGFTAVVPDLRGCITTGDTLEDLWANVESAQRDWLEEARNDGRAIPRPTQLDRVEFNGRFLVRMPRSLHRNLAQRAGLENVSINSLVVHLLSEGMGLWQGSVGGLTAHFVVSEARDVQRIDSVFSQAVRRLADYRWHTEVEEK